jgi:hypothetical protein
VVLHGRRQVELLEDARDVLLNGALRDHERVGFARCFEPPSSIQALRARAE